MDGELLIKKYEKEGVSKVKIAFTDIDGVQRGKYLSIKKFREVATGRSGFCDCVFGWDVRINFTIIRLLQAGTPHFQMPLIALICRVKGASKMKVISRFLLQSLLMKLLSTLSVPDLV